MSALLQAPTASRSSWLSSDAGVVTEIAVAQGDAAACCAACTADATCVAQQLDSVFGSCLIVRQPLLALPDVTQVDVPSWVAATPGEGTIYYRAPDTSSGGTQCTAFQSGAVGGATLLNGVGSRYMGDNAATLIFEGVYTEAGCCTLAQRYACSINPVQLWQHVNGARCVMHRQTFLERNSIPLAASFVRTLSTSNVTVPPGTSASAVFFTENPACVSANGDAAPCTEDAAAATCTTNPYETCYYDVLCKTGGLGCNAAGFEACRFCGFGQYAPVECPGSRASTQIDVTVQVLDSCPRACSSNANETCFFDPTCSNPLAATYADGLGCNAGNIGPNCRFCGFQARGWPLPLPPNAHTQHWRGPEPYVGPPVRESTA